MDELCAYLKNWFECGMYHAEFTISDGAIKFHDGSDMPLQENQYFRIIGSVFNDGVWQYNDKLKLTDETFDGSVWAMAVPPAVIAIAGEIGAWKAKYENVDSEAMSPYNSESFGGYQYSKGGSGASGGSTNPGWQGVFASRLNRWRKI